MRRPPRAPKRQISGGFDGFRVYEGKLDGGTVVLRVIVTGPNYSGSIGAAATEYWEVSLPSIKDQPFTFTLVHDLTSNDPLPALQAINGTTWIADLQTPVPNSYGTLEQNHYAWKTASGPKIAVKLLPVAQLTQWVRPTNTPVGQGWSQGDSVRLELLPSDPPYEFANSYWSEDEWLEWP